jgi:hypothetical protein
MDVVPYEEDMDYKTLETFPVEDDIIDALTHYDNKKIVDILRTQTITERMVRLLHHSIYGEDLNVPPEDRDAIAECLAPFVRTLPNWLLYDDILKTVQVSTTQALPEPVDTRVVLPSSESDPPHTQDVSPSRLSPPPESHSSLGHSTA